MVRQEAGAEVTDVAAGCRDDLCVAGQIAPPQAYGYAYGYPMPGYPYGMPYGFYGYGAGYPNMSGRSESRSRSRRHRKGRKRSSSSEPLAMTS